MRLSTAVMAPVGPAREIESAINDANDASPRPPKRPRTDGDAHYVHLPRPPSVQEARMLLPVCMHEQEIMEAIRAHSVVVVTGATGSGKTTQLPQFLIEAGFGDASSTRSPGCVAVTQPRRVAAVSCARRVASEVGAGAAELVGFHVRHRPEYGSKTRVKFVTDGILLREVQDDLHLRRYSAVVIDEAHERTLNTDLLLALLSRTVSLRQKDPGISADGSRLAPFKLIVMSATLDIDGIFAGPGSLFPSAPVVNVPARQHPVTVHFARRTSTDYLKDAFVKVCQINRKLPQGGILVFLTGRREVEEMCVKLTEELGVKAAVLPFFALLDDNSQKRVFDDFGERRKIVVATNVAETSVTIPGISYVVDSGKAKEKTHRGSGAGLLTSFDVVWISKASAEQRAGRSGRTGPGHCYRLYSSAMFNDHFPKFRTAEILRVPSDSVVLRLRSMGIRYLDKFPFPTKPDADALFAAESLLRTIGALDDTLESGSGVSCVREGVFLGVTPVGRALSNIPVPPRIGRMLLAATAVEGCLPYAARAAAILSLGEVLERHRDNSREMHEAFSHPASDLLTSLRALCAVEHTGRSAAAADGVIGVIGTAAMNAMRVCCENYGINMKTCVETIAIAEQLESCVCDTSIAPDTAFSANPNDATEDVDEEVAVKPKAEQRREPLGPMSEEIEVGLLRAFLCGFPDQVARRMTREEAAGMGVIPRRRKIAFTAHGCDEPVFLETVSTVALEEELELVAYAEILRTSRRSDCPALGKDLGDNVVDACDAEGSGLENGNDADECVSTEANDGPTGTVSPLLEEQVQARLTMRCATVISPKWLPVDARSICTFAPSRSAPAPLWDSKACQISRVASARYGPRQWAIGSIALPVKTFRFLTSNPGPVGIAAALREEGVVFAIAIVNGNVLEELMQFASVSSKGGGRIAVFGALLAKYEIDTESGLRAAMSADIVFGCKEYCDCLPRTVREAASKVWQQIGSRGVVKCMQAK